MRRKEKYITHKCISYVWDVCSHKLYESRTLSARKASWNPAGVEPISWKPADSTPAHSLRWYKSTITLSSELVVQINLKGVYGVKIQPPMKHWCGNESWTVICWREMHDEGTKLWWNCNKLCIHHEICASSTLTHMCVTNYHLSAQKIGWGHQIMICNVWEMIWFTNYVHREHCIWVTNYYLSAQNKLWARQNMLSTPLLWLSMDPGVVYGWEFVTQIESVTHTEFVYM